MDEDNSRDIHLDHHPITPHSCKHCQRIVLRRENFIQLPSLIKLPHTIPELRQAIKDRCELILIFASPEQPGHLLVCSGCPDCKDNQASHNRMLAERAYKSLPSSYEGLWPYSSSVYDRLNSLRSLWGHGGVWIELEENAQGEFPTKLTFKYKGLFKMRWIPSVYMCASGVTGVLSMREMSELITDCL